MKIVIAGGTGFVGKALTEKLLKDQHEVVILTRKIVKAEANGTVQYVQWLNDASTPVNYLEGTDIFINLAGESINSGRWSEQRKGKIVNSRIEAVDAVLDIMKKVETKPKALINASAIGIYGTSVEKIFTEEDKESENDFLSTTVKQWESRGSQAAELGIRTVFCRFGVILDRNEGALPKIALPYKAFIGGNIGNGRQWMSWIHIEDVVNGILFAINNEEIHGPVNFTAPEPVIMKEFGSTVASILSRPHWLPVPGFALRLLLGEMSTLVIDGQKVLPKKLMDHGFQFSFPELSTALKNIFT